MELHLGGKIHIASAFPLTTRAQLARAYTPGVAEVCRAIALDPSLMFSHTIKSDSVAVLSDGIAVLGMRDSGPPAAEPWTAPESRLVYEQSRIHDLPHSASAA